MYLTDTISNSLRRPSQWKHESTAIPDGRCAWAIWMLIKWAVKHKIPPSQFFFCNKQSFLVEQAYLCCSLLLELKASKITSCCDEVILPCALSSVQILTRYHERHHEMAFTPLFDVSWYCSEDVDPGYEQDYSGVMKNNCNVLWVAHNVRALSKTSHRSWMHSDCNTEGKSLLHTDSLTKSSAGAETLQCCHQLD